MQRKRGLELGRPFGFPLLVHRSWLGAGALLIFHLALTTFGAESLVMALLSGAGVAVGLFASLVVHEGAHALVRKLTGGRTIDATLFVFGGIARVAGEARSPLEEAGVGLAGPVTSGALGAGSLVAASFVPVQAEPILWAIGISNLALGGLNLFPALPLDGGRLLVSFLWRRGGDRSDAVRFASRGGEALGIAMLMTGAWLIVTSLRALPDAGVGLWLAVGGALVLSEAARSLRAAQLADRVAEGTAGAWARPFEGRVRSSTPVPANGGPYAVSDGSRLAGVLMPTTISSARGRRADEVMIPWTQEIALPAETPMSSVLQRLASSPTGVFVVLDTAGVVRGVIDSDGVRDRLEAG